MVIIRFSRCGRKNLPRYKILVADQRSKPTGRYIENVGYYIPKTNNRDHEYRLDIDRISYWLSKGAQLSDRVKSLLKSTDQYQQLKNIKSSRKKIKKQIIKPKEAQQIPNIEPIEPETPKYNQGL
jgi:small subunit ribosomal protein S16